MGDVSTGHGFNPQPALSVSTDVACACVLLTSIAALWGMDAHRRTLHGCTLILFCAGHVREREWHRLLAVWPRVCGARGCCQLTTVPEAQVPSQPERTAARGVQQAGSAARVPGRAVCTAGPEPRQMQQAGSTASVPGWTKRARGGQSSTATIGACV